MANNYDSLINAIRKIAKSDPDIEAVFTALKKRGGLPGVAISAGGDDNTGSAENCCSDSEPQEISDEDLPSIDGNAPPQMPSTPAGWTDCNTGQDINFRPQGFTLTESCKECGPDETWEQGFYWSVGGNIESYRRPTPIQVWRYWEQVNEASGLNTYSLNFYQDLGNRYVFYYTRTDISSGSTNDSILQVFRFTCSGSDIINGLFGCGLEEAPELCGEDWTPDDSTQYSLRNGCLVTSKCDPDAPSGSLGCNTEKRICKDGIEWIIKPTSDGGFIMYDPNSSNSGGKYNSAGTRTDILPPGETGGY